MFRDVEQERSRLAQELLDEERDEQAQQYLDADDESLPGEPEKYRNFANSYGQPERYKNYANGYGRPEVSDSDAEDSSVPEEKGLGGLVILACILAGGIVLVLIYWVLLLSGVLG